MAPARRASLWLLLAVAGFVRPPTLLPGDAVLTRRPAMQSARRASLWLLLAVVATLLTSAAAQRHRPAVCYMTCCRAHPSCTDATSVICDCPSMNQWILTSSVFPATIQNITIVRVQKITIDTDALGRLHHLERLDIKNVRDLKIQQHGLRLQTSSRLREFRVLEVILVNIHGSAFSGSWNQDAQVLMEGITVLTVNQKAFDYYSSSLGPSLTFSRVKLLNLASAAIVAPISRLFMRSVFMSYCGQNSIDGNVTRLLLDHVTISVAQTGCVIAGGDDIEQLSIRSCFFGTVQSQAFSGKINDVLISNTTMTSIHKNAFQIQVDKLQVNHASISELNPNGLTVSAKNDILFNNVRVDSLKRHALLGLKVNRSSRGKPPSIRIRSLYIGQPPEDGSLAFADCTPIRIEYLKVASRLPRVCPTERWTRRLVGVSKTARLTLPQYQVYRQLVRDHPCTKDSYRPLTDSDVADQGCTDGSSGPHGGGGETHEAGGSNRPGTDHTAGVTNIPDTGRTAGGSDSPGTGHTAGGSEREDNPHGSPRVASPSSPSKPADEDTHSPGDSGGVDAAAGRPGQTDTSDGHLALYLGLGLGGLALAALVTVGCLLFRWRRARAARLTCPPHAAAQKTRSVEWRQQSCSTGGCPSPARSEHAGTTATRGTAHCPPPEICDYAELPPAAPEQGDYAEIPGSADYADPVSMTGGGAAKYGDYAEIPGLGDYADPVSMTGGGAAKYGDYAEIPGLGDYADPVAMTGGGAAKYGDYAEIPGSANYADPVSMTGGGAMEYGDYAEIPGSADYADPVFVTGGQNAHVAPPASGRPADGRESAASVPPPLPPATAERLQMADGMLENVLYAPAQVWKRSGKEAQTTPGRN